MCYSITWGAPVLGPATFVPAAGMTSGWGYGGGRILLDIGPSFMPPGPLSAISATGTMNVTVPFTVNGPPGAVNVTLLGALNGNFRRWGSHGRVSFFYTLLPTLYGADGIVEIRLAGAPLFSVTPASISDSSLFFWTMGARPVARTGTRPGCTLTVGTTYQLFWQLSLAVTLAAIGRIFPAIPPGVGVSADSDFVVPMAPPTGLLAQIILPTCPATTWLTPGGGAGSMIPGSGVQHWTPPEATQGQ